MKKDREFWLDRGKNGKHIDGYICVGFGDTYLDLTVQLKVKSNFLFVRNDRDMDCGYNGSDPYTSYYLEEDKFNELFPIKQHTMDEQAAEYTITLPLSFLKKAIDALQVGFENTEEVFILNGQRATRSDRMNAARIENEMVGISNIITELKTFL